jgi:hypothetical protein
MHKSVHHGGKMVKGFHNNQSNIKDKLMSIWATTSVNSVPEIELRSWSVFEVASDEWENRTRHFVGYNVTECEGRVSSAIVQWDAATRRGVTASGRVYQLVGETGFDWDAQYVWSRWKDLNRITVAELVELPLDSTGIL